MTFNSYTWRPRITSCIVPLPRKTSTQRVAPAVFPKVCRSFQVASSGRLPIQILQASVPVARCRRSQRRQAHSVRSEPKASSQAQS